MVEFLKLWSVAIAAAGGVFLIVDMIWLRFAVPMFYRPVLGELLAPKFRTGPAVVFYLIYFAALGLFAVLPGFMSNGAPGLPLAGVPLSVVFGGAIGLTGIGGKNDPERRDVRRRSLLPRQRCRRRRGRSGR